MSGGGTGASPPGDVAVEAYGHAPICRLGSSEWTPGLTTNTLPERSAHPGGTTWLCPAPLHGYAAGALMGIDGL